MTQTQDQTQLKPHELSRSGMFGTSLEPVGGTASGYFVIQLSYNGTSKGYLNVNGSYWAVMSEVPLILEYYDYDGQTYYKIPNQNYYMSVSSNAYVGFYGWSGASTFTMDGTKLKSDENGQHLSFYSDSDQYIYCWDTYSVFDPVKLPEHTD